MIEMLLLRALSILLILELLYLAPLALPKVQLMLYLPQKNKDGQSLAVPQNN